MDLKKLFEKAKKTKKDGAKSIVPEFFVGEIILNDTLFETSQDGSSAFASSACTGQVDINLKKADVIVNGTTYKGLSVNVNEFDDESVWLINFNDVNVWNTAPIAVMVLIDSEGYCSDCRIATPEEGEYTISIKADGSRRMMKLHGASRTYSHTAEPRLVKQADGVKDWPIKKETAVIFDDSVAIETNSDTILIEDYSGTEEDFKQLKVEVNGEVIPYNADMDAYSVEYEFVIYPNITDIDMYSANGGIYQVKISEEQKVVAEDFKEAVVLSGLVTIIEGKQEGDDPEADVQFITLNEMMALLQSGKIVYLKYPYVDGVNMGLVTGMYYDAMNQITKISAIDEGTVKASLTVREDGMIIKSMK